MIGRQVYCKVKKNSCLRSSENKLLICYIDSMNRQVLKDALGWGILLWLIGYVLGILLFVVVPPDMLGWIIMPIGTMITIWVLVKKIKSTAFRYYVILSIVWTILAIIFDYFFLVKIFKPADGYYKLDVYVYYTLTFLLPLIIGWRKNTTK